MLTAIPVLQSLYAILVEATPEGHVINALIAVLFGFGLWAAIKQRRAIVRERGWLRQVKEHLKERQTDGAAPVRSLGMLHSITGLANFDSGLVAQTLVGKRIDALWSLRRIGRSGVEAISEVYATRQALSLEVPRYLTSILVLLGLAGTVWGLHGIVGQVSNVLSPNSADPMGALLKAFAPMRTAFSCTFVGILTSVVLAFVLTRVDIQQAELAAEIEETLTLQVIPLIFPESESAQLQQMALVLERSQSFLNQFGETLEQSRRMFIDTLGSAMAGAAQQFQAGLAGAADGLKDALQPVVAQVKQAGTSLEGNLDAMRGAADALNVSARNVNEYRQQIVADCQDLQNLLRETAQRLVLVSETVLKPIQAAAAAIHTVQTAVEGVGEQVHQDRAAWQHDAAELWAALKAVETIGTQIHRDQEEWRGGITDLQAALNGVTERVTQCQEGFMEAARQSGEAAAQHQQAADRSAEALEGLARRMSTELTVTLDDERLSELLLSINRLLEGIGTEPAPATESQILSDALPAISRQLDVVGAQAASLIVSLDRLNALGAPSRNPPAGSNGEQWARQHLEEMQQIRRLLQSLYEERESPGDGSHDETITLLKQSLQELTQMHSLMARPLWQRSLFARRNGAKSGTP